MVFPGVMYGCASWTIKKAESVSHSVMFDFLKPTRLFCPWNSPSRNIGVGGHFLLQGILPIQVPNLGILHCMQTLYQLSHQGSAKKAECQRTDAFKLWCWRRLFESPLDSKEVKPVNPKAYQPWIFIGRTDAKAESSVLWPPDVKTWLIAKDPDSGKD